MNKVERICNKQKETEINNLKNKFKEEADLINKNHQKAIEEDRRILQIEKKYYLMFHGEYD